LESSIPKHPPALTSELVRSLIEQTLDDNKAENIVTIDLRGKSDIADFMVIASGRSSRHVGTLAEHIQHTLSQHGMSSLNTEGKEQCDWVLVDALHVVVHLFRPEVREFYNLERMWDVPDKSASADTVRIGQYA
jgi:ribosome-associated protein